MKPAGRPRVKICCIRSREKAWMAIEHGASALGLVSAMPSGPGVIPDDAIAQVGPFALDVCSGVRTNGHLDEGKLARLFAAVTAAS